MDITHWAKTQEGLEVIEAQKPFVINGEMWQGYEKAAIRVHEDQLTDEEMTAVFDVDQTKERIWKTRLDRIQARLSRKNAEYGKRLVELRKERSGIKQSIKEDIEMGLQPSPSDLHEINEIDARMMRLRDLGKEKSLATAKEAHAPTAPEPELEGAAAQVQCVHCEKISPESHHNPAGWLRGHHIHCRAKN